MKVCHSGFTGPKNYWWIIRGDWCVLHYIGQRESKRILLEAPRKVE